MTFTKTVVVISPSPTVMTALTAAHAGSAGDARDAAEIGVMTQSAWTSATVIGAVLTTSRQLPVNSISTSCFGEGFTATCSAARSPCFRRLSRHRGAIGAGVAPFAPQRSISSCGNDQAEDGAGYDYLAFPSVGTPVLCR